jgi:hypothetical protein
MRQETSLVCKAWVGTILTALTLVLVQGAQAKAMQASERASECAVEGSAAPGLHAELDQLLSAFVSAGRVDYECFQARENELDRYLSTLARTDPSTLSEAARIALWINAYNAYTIKLVLTRYPELESIRDIPRRWKIRRWTVGGERYSLDEIEHEILRKEFDEPRIHFAIVCASISCPDLAPEAYTADRLEEQLDRAARGFLASRDKGFRLEAVPGEGARRAEVRLSSIFKWFRKDFERRGSLIEYVLPLIPAQDRRSLESHVENVRVRFLDYDWNLNDA